MKLGDYHRDHYRTYYAALAPSTAQGYEGDWSNHIEWAFAAWEMEEIRVRHINAWLASDHFAGRPGAARSAYGTLRQMLRSAMGDELYDEAVTDPTTRGIRLPKMEGRAEPQHLSAADANRLMRGLVGYEYEATALCGLWLGLRRSEQCGMQWGDIDMRTGLLRVQRGLQKVDGQVVETAVKTHRSARPHLIPRTGLARLREIKRERRPRQTDYLMDVADPERYARTLRAWCRRHGLPYVAPKYFRHTFKTLHELGATPSDVIRKMMGHVGEDAHFRYMALDADILRKYQRNYERLILAAYRE